MPVLKSLASPPMMAILGFRSSRNMGMMSSLKSVYNPRKLFHKVPTTTTGPSEIMDLINYLKAYKISDEENKIQFDIMSFMVDTRFVIQLILSNWWHHIINNWFRKSVQGITSNYQEENYGSMTGSATLKMIQWNLSITTTSIMKFITCDLFGNVF